jgi:chromatin segregation and condensation protein Rec8/ScpA/Scc1 (kleisin family)
MAAELMQIKVKMLLPRDEGEEEGQDPRADLVRRLLEYKRYKEMAEKFSSFEDEARYLFDRWCTCALLKSADCTVLARRFILVRME